MEIPPFPGFRPQAFTFLRDLAANNRRDWFKPRKALYDDEVVWPFKCLLIHVAQKATAHGFPLAADPKKSIFRIYRDVRFSHNKDPYKTSAGGVLTRSGDKKDTGGVYIHIEPDKSMLAAGFWRPSTKFIALWRATMVREPAAAIEVFDALADLGLKPSFEDALKRPPRGYETSATEGIADLMRLKSYVVSRSVDEAETHDPRFAETVFAFVQNVYPLLLYGWNVTAR